MRTRNLVGEFLDGGEAGGGHELDGFEFAIEAICAGYFAKVGKNHIKYLADQTTLNSMTQTQGLDAQEKPRSLLMLSQRIWYSGL